MPDTDYAETLSASYYRAAGEPADTTDYVAEAELNVTAVQRAERSQAAFEAMFDHTPRTDTRGPDYQLRPVSRH